MHTRSFPFKIQITKLELVSSLNLEQVTRNQLYVQCMYVCTYHGLQFPEDWEEQGEERDTVDHQEGLKEEEETLVEADETLQWGHARAYWGEGMINWYILRKYDLS